MHYHHSWDGFYAGTWETAARAYKSIMRDTSNINLVTVLREPVSHYLSYYYYYMQPLAEVSITIMVALNCIAIFQSTKIQMK